MVHDMIEVEKMGVPAVPIISGRFDEDAAASSRAFGMPGLQWVVVPRIYRNLALDLCVKQTEDAIDDLIAALTSSGNGAATAIPELAETERFEGEDRHDAILAMNEKFIAEDLGDGFLLEPPTRKAVDRLLAGTSLAPDHVVCDMPPGFGIATVEKIAINAAMAGAKPEHMPVIIAAVEGLSKLGGQGGKSLLMSTSPSAPLLMVNGPIANAIGLNSRSALGPGRDNQVNTIVGRAFSLCFKNIGYWYAGKMDMDTIGTTRKFIQCVAENEEASPWDPFHVDRGFNRDDSAVSVFVTNGELDVGDQGNTEAEGLLKTLANGISFGSYSIQGRGGAQRLIFMPPDVAGPIGGQEFTKQAAKEFIHAHAEGSLGKMIHYMPLEGEARVADEWRWLQNLTEEQRAQITVPILSGPDSCYIVVVGADRAKTAVFPSGPAPVTVGIDQYMP
jgi:hypothetical protein